MPRLCSRCALTRVTADRTECRACADDAAKHKGFEWQVRKYLEDHEDLKNFTYTDTALPCAVRKASSARRADFTYVLEDRVVFLEVDENEHRYNSPDCERRREQQLADTVSEGKHVVLVRYNPLAKWTTWMINLERLGKALREAFVTEDVRLADDGVHRMYVGYQMAQIRKLDAAYENVQRRAIEEARARDETNPGGDGESPDERESPRPPVPLIVDKGESRKRSTALMEEIVDLERDIRKKKKLLAEVIKEEDEGENERGENERGEGQRGEGQRGEGQRGEGQRGEGQTVGFEDFVNQTYEKTTVLHPWSDDVFPVVPIEDVATAFNEKNGAFMTKKECKRLLVKMGVHCPQRVNNRFLSRSHMAYMTRRVG